MKNLLGRQSEFTRNVLKMLSGSAAAHALMFITTPLLARLFAQEDIGSLQIYISTVMIFGVVASLKYEMAIVLPRDEREAEALTLLSIWVTFLFSMLLALFLLLAGHDLCRILDAQAIEPYLLLIVLGNLTFGLWQVFQYVLTRHKAFGRIASNRLIQVFLSQALAVLFGLFRADLRMLLLMQVVGWGVAVFLIYLKYPLNSRIKPREVWALAKKYHKFPTFNTAMIFLNNFSLQLPVFMLSKYYSPEIVAYYAMANRVVNFPLFLVGRSVRQVYFQSASEAYYKSARALKAVYMETVRKLSYFALPPLLITGLFGPWIAKMYLGANYVEAGVYMQIIAFWMFFQFLNSPISSTMTIIDRQEFGFLLILASLGIRFYVMMRFSASPREMLWALSIAAGVFYLIYNLTIYLLIQQKVKKS